MCRLVKGYSVLMSSIGATIVQNALFGTRNSLLGTGVMAPEQNNQVRTLVALGQAKNMVVNANKLMKTNSTGIINFCGNLANEGSIFDKIFTKVGVGAQKVPQKLINLCNTVAENSKVFGKLEKAVDFASKNVNNLICVSSGVKVLTAKDKQSECIAQAGNLIGMFAVEGWMKKNLFKYVEKLPINSKMKPVIEGILFVIGSITGSTICYNIGKKAAAKLKACNEEYKAKEQNKAPQKIEIKA